MPGFHNHNGADTYYFVPKRHGDFHTYQLEEEARDMVLATGKSDGDIVSWDIFYTLNDLGLLYFKNSGSDPRETAPDPESVDFDIVSELPVGKRCAFVERVLDQYPLHAVDSEAFHRVVASLDGEHSEAIHPVLAQILSNTPMVPEIFESIYMGLAGVPESVGSVTVSVFFHYAYDGLRDNETRNRLLNAYDSEKLFESSGYEYYLVPVDQWESETESNQYSVSLPSPYVEPFESDAHVEHFTSSCEFFIQEAVVHAVGGSESLIGNVLSNGLRENDLAVPFIVPADESGQESADTSGLLEDISESFSPAVE